MYDHIQQYKLQGYQPIANNSSGIGAEVLINASLDRIVKFGQDSAYCVDLPQSAPLFPRFCCLDD